MGLFSSRGGETPFLSYTVCSVQNLFLFLIAMDDLTKQWNCLSLSEREGDDLCIKKDRQSKEHIIAALFLTRRALNMEAVARTFKPLWRSENGFKIQREGDHKVLFVFDNKEDVDRILSTEPWSFDKSLVVTQRFERNSSIEELCFDKASFWVQVHNIPIRYRNRSVAEDICDSIGQVHRSVANSEGGGGSFMRVRVTLDVYQPLCRGRVIKLEDGEKIWVSFKYERLPNFCYWCGCFDHGDKDCDIWIQSKGTLQSSSQQYGSWLRAPPYAPTNNRVIRVSGYYEDREENISTRRRRAEKQSSIPVSTPVRETQPEKETADTGADFMEFMNLNVEESTELNKDKEQNLRDPETTGDRFEQQTREIDKELGFNENSIIREPTIDPRKQQAMQAIIDVGKETQKEKHVGPRELSQVHPLPFSDISNAPNLSGVADKNPHPTWKRLAHLSVSSQVTVKKSIGAKRPVDMVVDNYELPCKKLVVSSDDKENFLVLAETGSQSRQFQ